MELEEERKKLYEYLKHRSTEKGIISEIKQKGFSCLKSKSDITKMRFVDAEAILNHSLIRIGFREYWDNMMRAEIRAEFYKRLVSEISKIIESRGVFLMTIPMLYLEFEK